MKKTLIALLALAGVAMGEEITMPSGHLSPIAFGQNSTSITLSSGSAGLYIKGTADKANWNNWMMEFTITSVNIENGSTFRFFQANGSSHGGLELYVAKDDAGALSLGFSDGGVSKKKGDAITLDVGSVYRASYHGVISGSTALYDKLYLTNTTTGEYIEANAGMYDYAIFGKYAPAEMHAGDSKLSITIGDCYNMYDHNGGTETQKQEFKAYATAATNKAVPEPTTATLSLLALAGLAARRRRK